MSVSFPPPYSRAVFTRFNNYLIASYICRWGYWDKWHFLSSKGSWQVYHRPPGARKLRCCPRKQSPFLLPGTVSGSQARLPFHLSGPVSPRFTCKRTTAPASQRSRSSCSRFCANVTPEMSLYVQATTIMKGTHLEKYVTNANGIKHLFGLHHKLFVVFCVLLDTRSDSHEKMQRYRLMSDMSRKDILSLSPVASLPMAACGKGRKHMVSANNSGKLYSPTILNVSVSLIHSLL